MKIFENSISDSLLFYRRCSNESSEMPLLTQQRHRDMLERASQCLESYLSKAKHGETRSGGGHEHDFAMDAEELRLAAKWLGNITGSISSEDILDVIFSDFCIGK